MLQALSMETAAPAAKSRNGTGSDPAEAVFAGMMAQASSAQAQPATVVKPSDDSRKVEKAESRASQAQDASKAEPSDDASAVRKVAQDKDDQAKAADSKPEPKKAEVATDQDDAAAAKGEPTPATPAVPASASAPAQPAIPAAQASPQALQTPSRVEAPPAEDPATTAKTAPPALPKGIEQKTDATDTQKPALTELLSVPKVEIQTPKLTPETAAAPVDAKKTAPAGQTSSNGKAGPGQAQIQAPPQAVEADSKTHAAAPVLAEDFAAALRKADAPAPQAPSAKATVDPSLVPQVEAVKTAATSAVTHAEATTAARPSPVLAQVEGTVRWILQNKTQGAELQLHPESLGRMVIQLRVEGQDVHARVWASEPSSMAVLQDHKAFLESSLKEQGLNLSSFDLQSGARGNGANQELPPSPVASGLAPSEVKQEMPKEAAPVVLDAHQIEVYA